MRTWQNILCLNIKINNMRKYLWLFISLLFFSCSSNYDGDAVKELENWLSHHDNAYSYCVVIPGAGCEGCILEGERFAREYSGRSDVLFVFTRITTLKMLKFKLGERASNACNILYDVENRFVEMERGKDNIYPVVCKLENNKIKELYYVSPEQKTDIIGELKKRLDTTPSVIVNLTDYIESEKEDEVTLSGLVDSLEYIPLQTPDDIPVDVLLAVKMSSDNIFVMDRQQKLYRFDMQGRFLNLIGSRGEGPQEYISAVNFEVDEDRDAVYLFDIYRKKIKSYRMSGTFMGDISVPDGVESIALLNVSSFIGYKPWYTSVDKFDQCIFFDNATEVHDTIAFRWNRDVKEVKVDLFRMPDFNQISSLSRFRMPFDPVIYMISDGNKVRKDVEFEMGKYLLPIEVSMNNELYNKNLDSSYIFELNANRFSDFIYMNFFYRKNRYRVVYDVRHAKFYTVFVGRELLGVKNDLDGGATFWPMWFTSNRMIGVLSTEELDAANVNDKTKGLYDMFKDFDNPILQIGHKIY